MITPYRIILSLVGVCLIQQTAEAFFAARLITSRRVPIRLGATKESTFGMGCFWKPSEELLKVPGVIDTVAGYTGKPTAQQAPNYEQVCFSRDWVEAVRVQYDDDQISYAQLLDAFFEAQEPKPGSRQYGSYIFPHNQEQEERAKEWLQSNQDLVRKDGVPASFTRIEALSPFYKAEEYHQRYWQKMRPRLAAMVVLTAVGTGIMDRFTPMQYVSPLHTAANAIVLAGLLYVILERKIDNKVVRL